MKSSLFSIRIPTRHYTIRHLAVSKYLLPSYTHNINIIKRKNTLHRKSYYPSSLSINDYAYIFGKVSLLQLIERAYTDKTLNEIYEYDRR